MLFCNIDVLDEGFILKRGQYVGTRDGMIDYIGRRRTRIMVSGTMGVTVCCCPASTMYTAMRP